MKGGWKSLKIQPYRTSKHKIKKRMLLHDCSVIQGETIQKIQNVFTNFRVTTSTLRVTCSSLFPQWIWEALSSHCHYLTSHHKQQNLAGILGFPLEVSGTCPDIPAPARSEAAKEISTKSLWMAMTKTKATVSLKRRNVSFSIKSRIFFLSCPVRRHTDPINMHISQWVKAKQQVVMRGAEITWTHGRRKGSIMFRAHGSVFWSFSCRHSKTPLVIKDFYSFWPNKCFNAYLTA